MNIPKGKLFALVAVFAAIGLVTATGAFTTVTAERTAKMNVAGDSSALVAIEPTSGPNAGYFSSTQGTAQLDLSSANGGSGVNLRATTGIKNVFTITNQGTQEVAITLTQSDENDTSTDSSDTEENAIRFAVSGDAVSSTNGGNVDEDIPFASGTYEQISDTGSADWAEKGVILGTGESITVSIYIDTSANADFDDTIGDSSVGNLAGNQGSEDLIDTITVHASADETGTATLTKS